MNWILWGIFSGLLLRAGELSALGRSIRIGPGDFLIGLAGTVFGSLLLYLAIGLIARAFAILLKRDWFAKAADRFLLALLQAALLFTIWWALRADLVSLAGSSIGKLLFGAMFLASFALFFILRPALKHVPAQVPAALLLVAVAAVAMGGTFGPISFTRADTDDTTGDRPNIVLILIDTVRKDRLQFDRQVTRNPSLAKLARTSVRYTKARSTSSWTAPAVAGILTSRYPSQHGVHHGTARLSPGELSFVEILQQSGYRTAAVTANSVIGRSFGFAQGFDFYLDTKNAFPFGFFLDQISRLWKLRFEKGSQPGVQAFFHRVTRYYQHAEQVTRNARALADGLAKEEEPFFLLVHYMDPHRPYRAPLRFWREEEAEYDGPVDGFEYMKYDESAGAFRAGDVKLGPDDVAQFVRLYDAEIRHVDDAIGRLVAGLKSAGTFEESYVLVTSDHGEYFGEHGLSAHSNAYAPCIDVPLLVRPPGGAVQSTYNEYVQTRQIPATVLSWSGLDDAAAAMEAPAIPLPALGTGEALDHAFVEAEDGDAGFRRAVERGDWKLIRGASGEELYDRSADPDELVNVLARVSSDPDLKRTYGTLDSLLASFEESMNAMETKGENTTTEQREALRALGYLD